MLDALGSPMQNKYSEGYPGQRYYAGNEHMDAIETLCQRRALDAFGLNPAAWGVNVQPLSGSPANLYAYAAVCRPHDRIMGLDLPHGGHLSHGYQLPGKKISRVSAYFETLPYRLDPATGLIDYDGLDRLADLYRPRVIVAGATAYSRLIDYARIKATADRYGAYLLADMAHISGMVATGAIPSPFPHADMVTTTTHKSLRGPRGALIFFRRGTRSVDKKGKAVPYELEQAVNESVFPGHQGGPHNHTITAMAVALGQARTPQFRDYQQAVLKNARALARKLLALDGYDVVSGGTDNHLLLLDLKRKAIDGSRVERVLELANIVTNKNTVPGDKSALRPGGLRLGSPAMTTRGVTEADFEHVAVLLDRGVEIARMLDARMTDSRKFKDFAYMLGDGAHVPEIAELKAEVTRWAGGFPLPWSQS